MINLNNFGYTKQHEFICTLLYQQGCCHFSYMLLSVVWNLYLIKADNNLFEEQNIFLPSFYPVYYQ